MNQEAQMLGELGGLLGRFHPVRGLMVKDNIVDTMQESILLNDEQPEAEFSILDTPVGIYCQESYFMFFDNHIITPKGNTILPLNRGDRFKVSLNDGIGMFSVHQCGEWHDIASFIPLNKETLSLSAHGTMICVQGEHSIMQPFLTRLQTRTEHEACLQVWEKPLTAEELMGVVKLDADVSTHYYILQTLTMSPVPLFIEGIMFAEAHLGLNGLVRYHQSQLRAAYQFVKTIGESAAEELIAHIACECRTNTIQSGVSAQMFRVMLKVFRNSNNKSVVALLDTMAQTQVAAEGMSRNNGQYHEAEDQRAIWHYMQAYQLAYSWPEFSVIQMMRDIGMPATTILKIAISCLYMEPDAVQLFDSMWKKQLQLETSILKNPKMQESWLFLYQNMARETFSKRLINHAMKHITSKPVLLFCVRNIEHFPEQAQAAILYQCFKSQQHIAGLKAMSPVLAQAPFIKNNTDGFSLDALNYRRPSDDFYTAQQAKIEQLKANFTVNLLKRIQHSQQVFDMPQVDIADLLSVTNEKPAEEPKIEAAAHDEDEDSNEDLCPICYSPMRDFVTLHCTHRICADCICNITATCPMCRAEVVGFKYHEHRYEPLKELFDNPEYEFRPSEAFLETLSEADRLGDQAPRYDFDGSDFSYSEDV